MDLISANKNRAANIAEACADALRDSAGAWHSYKSTEDLKGYLEATDLIRYERPSNRLARIYFVGVHPSQVSDVDFDEEVVVEADVAEKHSQHLRVPADVKYRESLDHTFNRSVSADEALKDSIEVAARQIIGTGDGAPVNFKAEFEEKAAHELSRRFGQAESTTDSISRGIEFMGPRHLVWEASRSLDKSRRTVRATADFECRIVFADETKINDAPSPMPSFWDVIGSIFTGKTSPTNQPHNRYEYAWASVADFIAVATGHNAIESSALYGEFRRAETIGANTLRLIQAPAGKSEWTINYDCRSTIDDNIYDAETGTDVTDEVTIVA